MRAKYSMDVEFYNLDGAQERTLIPYITRACCMFLACAKGFVDLYPDFLTALEYRAKLLGGKAHSVASSRVLTADVARMGVRFKYGSAQHMLSEFRTRDNIAVNLPVLRLTPDLICFKCLDLVEDLPIIDDHIPPAVPYVSLFGLRGLLNTRRKLTCSRLLK